MNTIQKNASGFATALALMISAGSVSAQETLSYDWEGGYGGVFLGGSFFGVEMSDLTDTFTNDSPPVSEVLAVAGINIGYNWIPRDDNLLLGFELDVQAGNETNQLVRFNAAGTDGQLYENKINSLATVRGRAGVIDGNFLTYLTGGASFANVTYRATDLDPAILDPTCASPGIVCAETSETLVGLSAGAGMEYAFRENATMRFELMHYMLPTASAGIFNGDTTPVCFSAQADECSAYFSSGVTQFRFGVNFNF
jgi:outer membrane immunogenic protein